jgi:hypothetical protein
MRQMPPADLSRWAGTFSCYTAPLAVWLAARREDWWRPLLTGAPTLAVRPAGDGLMRFEHHPRPPLAMLGLRIRQAEDWFTAGAGHRAELAASGAVVVCGDTYRLPWQRGYRRWHAPHWFTVVAEGAGWVVDDPLDLQTMAGPQSPYRAPVTADQLTRWGIGPARYSRAQHLRELSVAGAEPLGIGVRYRWLVAGDPAPVRDAGPAALTGPAAVRALADLCRQDGPDTLAIQQADDVWQALRHRELFLAATAADPDLAPPDVREHWQAAVALWRRIPPALLHTRLRLEKNMPVDRHRVAEVFEAVAGFEVATEGARR